MAIPWGALKSLLLFFGPMLLPRAISYYRSAKSGGRGGSAAVAIQPCPQATRRSLAIIVLIPLIWFAYVSIPAFAPENVFKATQSRIQIPTEVLFTRLAAMRPNNTLTPEDLAMRSRFVNLESRLLYFQHGPDALSSCAFCSSDDPMTYMYYTLPMLFAPHCLNLVLIAAATSLAITGVAGSRWRTTATITAIVVGLTDFYVVSTYSYQANARALKVEALDPFFWNMRLWRAGGIAALDVLLAALIWLTATNRMFAKPPSTAERLESLFRAISLPRSKVQAAGVIRNTTARDEQLRNQSQAYWAHEVRLLREVMEEREVIDGINDALSNRIDLDKITNEAGNYAETVIHLPGPDDDNSNGETE